MPHPKRMFVQKKKVAAAANAAYPFVFDPSGAFGASFDNVVVSVAAYAIANGIMLPLHCCWSYDAANSLKVHVFDTQGAEMDPADAAWANRAIELHVIASDPR